MSNKDEESITKISKMLEIGGTMLAKHCEVCGSPLFRYKGNILCPVCNDNSSQPLEQQTAVESSAQINKLNNQKLPLQGTIEQIPHNTDDLSYLKKSIINKLNTLGTLIQEEKDIRRLQELFDIVNTSLNILDRLQ